VIITGRNRLSLDAAVDRIRSSARLRQRRIGDSAPERRRCPCFVRHRRVTILFNNLGIYEMKDFAAITDADLLRSFEVNVLSGPGWPWPYFPGSWSATWGRIIFISMNRASSRLPR